MRTVSDLIGDEYLNWKPGIPYVLSSQTGQGKTTFVMTRLLRNAAAQNRDVLYICNRRTLHAQVEQIISNMMQELKSAFSLTEEESSHLIIQTYQYYEASMRNPLIYSHKMYIIFDEAHYFLEDASFNSRTNLWANWINKFYETAIHTETPICVFMSATPELLRCFLTMVSWKKTFSTDTFLENVSNLSEKKHNLKYEIKSGTEDFYRRYRTNKKDLDRDLPRLLLELCPGIIDKKEELQSLDVYGMGKERVQNAIAANYGLKEICNAPDYSYVEESYFREFSELVDIIRGSDGKWVIFINDSIKGQQYAQQLNDLDIEAVFVNSSLKNKSVVKEQLKKLESQQCFSCRVLSSTSILDCGVNIIDDTVQNVAIFELGKTRFIQMLGRVRVQANRKIRLFIKAPTAQEIRDNIRYACKNIQVMSNFHMMRKNKYLDHGLITRFKPVMGMTQRQHFLRNLQGANYQNICIRPDLIVGNNGINNDVQRDWKENIIFSEFGINRNYLVRLLYALYCFDQAKAYMQEGKADDIYYLKYQLSWLGKEYDERRWVSYTRQQDEITAFLAGYLTNEDGMLAEEQNVFAEKVLELLCQLSVIPSAAKKNRSALKRNNRIPGKNILNKCFEEIGLPYVITSKSKMQNGKREQRWYVKRRTAEIENGG